MCMNFLPLCLTKCRHDVNMPIQAALSFKARERSLLCNQTTEEAFMHPYSLCGQNIPIGGEITEMESQPVGQGGARPAPPLLRCTFSSVRYLESSVFFTSSLANLIH